MEGRAEEVANEKNEWQIKTEHHPEEYLHFSTQSAKIFHFDVCATAVLSFSLAITPMTPTPISSLHLLASLRANAVSGVFRSPFFLSMCANLLPSSSCSTGPPSSSSFLEGLPRSPHSTALPTRSTNLSPLSSGFTFLRSLSTNKQATSSFYSTRHPRRETHPLVFSIKAFMRARAHVP